MIKVYTRIKGLMYAETLDEANELIVKYGGFKVLPSLVQTVWGKENEVIIYDSRCKNNKSYAL